MKEAIAQNTTFEGKNATEYRDLLAHQNGWRPVVSNTQKAQVGFKVTSNTSLIGLDANAALNGINLYVSSVDNVWIRNLKLISPADCFPAPETFPASWNGKSVRNVTLTITVANIVYRFDAVGLVTSTNVWVDGCELQDQLSGEYVQPDHIDPGWEVDRFDGKLFLHESIQYLTGHLTGLFDCEDGSDNVTFSHNIVRNHHKSMLLGGGTKEADRDLGKMHFTIFGNHFNNSASRNPLMRFGTFDIFANVFESINNNDPRFDSSVAIESRDEEVLSDAEFQYHLGVYNQSTIQVKDNVFLQVGSVADDTSRLFTISEATLPDRPARICIPDSDVPTTLNGEVVNMDVVAQDTIDYFVESGKTVEGAVLVTCDGVNVGGYTLPQTFSSPDEVKAYVTSQAGQV